MIDTSSITALISAFRAEVAQNSISPEKVGGILQQIVDALSKAASNGDVADFLALQERLQALTTIYTSLTQGTSDRNHVYLTPTTYNVAKGEHYTNADSIRIQQATTERAGAMRAQQVIDLNAAKKNITELQTALQSWQTNYGTLNSAVGTLQEELKFLQEDTEMNGEVIIEIEDDIIFLTTALAEIQDIRTITVEVKDRFLTVQGAGPLLDKNMQPYLFRFTKKANRKRYTDSTGNRIRKKNKPRKGWHLMGDKDTLKIDKNTFEISINTTVHGANREPSYSYHPMDFIKLSTDKHGHKQVAYGKRLISLWNGENNSERKVELKYGIAFGFRNRIGGMPIEMLYTNIAEFSIIYDPKSCSWSFSK